MRVPLDILDYILSFLVSDRKTLIACSKDPLLSPIVERHVYYHIIIQIGTKATVGSNGGIEPIHLSELVSKNPQIVHYVRILQIDIQSPPEIIPKDNSFATTLLKFPVIECIKLSVRRTADWHLLGPYRAALEDRLNLPTVKELHLTGDGIPLSLLNSSKNIKNLSLSGFSIHGQLCTSTLPQLHSLKSTLSRWKDLSDILGVCSGTLNKLDFELGYLQFDSDACLSDLAESPLVLPNLKQLTIHATEGNRLSHYYHSSWLPVVPEVVKLFKPSLRHLSIQIWVASNLTRVNFSPLAALGPATQSISRIDLYVHTGILSSSVTHAHVLSSLEVYEDIARSIKEGVFVIHSEKIAPDLTDWM